jgi:sortase (surface protein transpeptidase)
VLLLAAAVAITAGFSGQQRWLGGPVSTAGKPAGAPGVRSAARSVPLALSIPAIGLKAPLSELGLNPNHTVQVPSNFQEPGWYKFGPSPGQLGSAVILGHVDSYLGPAVFFLLKSLQPGDSVDVTLADGVVTHFVVRQVAMYPKVSFPTFQVYGSHGYSALQLVTCGGEFDAQTRSYLSNVVVYTSLVSAS